MAELAFLSGVRAYLGAAALTPAVAPERIGAIEPAAVADLPCIVLSLESTARRRIGLGEGSEPMTGALPVDASIDLASPTLPGDSTFPLIDDTRRIVTLPHGGLVRSDGAEAIAPLGPSDISVRRDGAPLTVVAGAPAAGQVQADPVTGHLRTGDTLPASGTLAIRYFLGQWERRVERIAGVLRLDACAQSAADAERLADSCIERLLAPAAAQHIVQLTAIELSALGTVEQRHAAPPPQSAGVTHFRRRAAFAFEYQRFVDRVESSGGVIRRIVVTSRLEALRVDRATGTVVTDTFVETT